jgi:hypothetical protein
MHLENNEMTDNYFLMMITCQWSVDASLRTFWRAY